MAEGGAGTRGGYDDASIQSSVVEELHEELVVQLHAYASLGPHREGQPKALQKRCQ